MKINIGLIGILVIIIFTSLSFLYLNTKTERLLEELNIIKGYVIDIDDDIHEIEKNLDQ